MTIQTAPDSLTHVRVDLEQRRRALATNAVIFGTRHMPEALDLLRGRSRVTLFAARRLAETLQSGRPWDPVTRRDVRDVLHALATAARSAAPRTKGRERAEWLRDRLRELQAQDVRICTLSELLRITTGRRVLVPAKPKAKSRR